MNVRITTLAAVLAATVLAPSCGAPAPTETTLERIRRTGTVRVGYANEAPYAYFDSSADRLTGEAPEIAKVLFADLGVAEVEGVLTEFGSLIPGLKAKRFDLIAAGMYITPERCREVAFSTPTYGIGEAFVVRAGNPLELHGYDDVANHPTARLGVVAGTVERGYARDTGIDDDRVVVFPDAPSAIAGVASDRIDAYAGTSLTVQDLLDKAADPTLARAVPFRDPIIAGKPAKGYGAFAVRQEDAALLEALDTGLGKLLGSPRHAELVRPFGFTEAELPADVTVAQLCAATDANP